MDEKKKWIIAALVALAIWAFLIGGCILFTPTFLMVLAIALTIIGIFAACVYVVKCIIDDIEYERKKR